MGSQTLDEKTGQAILTKKKCPHGLFCDERGNNACERCMEHGRTGSYLLGISTGWEQVHKLYAQRAGEAYAAGQDEKAKLLRDLATEAKKTDEARRKDYDRHKAGHEEE